MLSKAIHGGLAALLVLGVTTVAAMPATDLHPNLVAFIRDENSAYHPSEEMAKAVKARSDEFGLTKRAHATVQACFTNTCTNCYTVWDASFSSNSACLSAINTACLIISDLDDANVEFWNRKLALMTQ